MSGNLFQHCTIPKPPVRELTEVLGPVSPDTDTDQLTPEQIQNDFQKQVFKFTRAPQKRTQPPILKSKVAQNDIGEMETEGFVVRSNTSLVNQTIPNGHLINSGTNQKPNAHPNIIHQKSVNGFPRKGRLVTQLPLPVRKCAEMNKTSAAKGSTVVTSNSAKSRLRINAGNSTAKNEVSSTMHHRSNGSPSGNLNPLVQANSSTTILYPPPTSREVTPSSSANQQGLNNVDAVASGELSNRFSSNEIYSEDGEGDNLKNLHDPPAAHCPIKENKEKRKPAYFRSKFWDYIEPNKKSGSTSRQQKGKNYDQVKVRGFMEKQKEMRRLKEKQEEEEKKKSAEKTKLNVQVVTQKQKNAVKQSLKREAPPQLLNDLPHSLSVKQSRTKSNLTPMKVTRSVHSNENADSALRTSLLLHEFENIVHNECLNVLKTHSEKMSGLRTTKVDKAVETTMSLFDGHGETDASSSISTSPTVNFPLETLAMKNVVSSASAVSAYKLRNHAAAKIQSAYRGYRLRKLLREANSLPGQNRRERRRRSFYRASEAPSDPNTINLLAWTPTKHSLSPHTPDDIRRSYIPPPPGYSLSPSSVDVSEKSNSTRSRSLPYPTSLTPSKHLSRFEEPFPTEAIRKLLQSSPPGLASNSNATKRRLSLESRCMTHSNSKDNRFEPVAMDRRLSLNFECPVPLAKPFDIDTVDLPVPTFSTVLKEKIRILQEKTFRSTAGGNRNQIPNASPATSSSRPEQEQRKSNITKQPVYQYESDSASNNSFNIRSEKTGETSKSITSDYIAPHADEMQRAYELRKGKKSEFDPSNPRPKTRDVRQGASRQSMPQPHETKSNAKARKLSSPSPSTTTVETDMEFKGHEEKHMRKSQPQMSSPDTSSSISLKRYPVPALELAYKAEKERLNILDQALQTTLALEAAKAQQELQKAAGQAQALEIQSLKVKATTSNSNTNNNNSEVMVQLARCQAEQLRATAEVTRWVSELRKSSVEQEALRKQEQPINMAAIVIAAVEESKKYSQERELRQTQQAQQEQPISMTAAVNAAVEEAKKYSLERELLQIQQALAQAQKFPYPQKIHIKDQVSQFPSESSNSETPQIGNRMKMKATEKGTQLLESQVRRLHEEQKQKLISSQSDHNVNSDTSISTTQGDLSYSSNFEEQSAKIVEQRSNETAELSKSQIPRLHEEENKSLISIRSDQNVNSDTLVSSTKADPILSYSTNFEGESPTVSRKSNEQSVEFLPDPSTESTMQEIDEVFSKGEQREESAAEFEDSSHVNFVSGPGDRDEEILPEDEEVELIEDVLVKSDSSVAVVVEDETPREESVPSTESTIQEIDEVFSKGEERENSVTEIVGSTQTYFDSGPGDRDEEIPPEDEVELIEDVIIKSDYSVAVEDETQREESAKIVEEQRRIENETAQVSKSQLPGVHEEENQSHQNLSSSDTSVSSTKGEPSYSLNFEGKSPTVTRKSNDEITEFLPVPSTESTKHEIDEVYSKGEGREDPASEFGGSAHTDFASGPGDRDELILSEGAENEWYKDAFVESDSCAPEPVLVEDETPKEESAQIVEEKRRVDKETAELSKSQVPGVHEEENQSDQNVNSDTSVSSTEGDPSYSSNFEGESPTVSRKSNEESGEFLPVPSTESTKEEIDAVFSKVEQREDSAAEFGGLSQANFVSGPGDRDEDIFPEGEEEEWFEDDLAMSSSSLPVEDELLREEAAKIVEEQQRIENEIRVLEALAAREIPDKPPPPYSPPSSSGSSSLSLYSRFFSASFDEHKLRDMIHEQVEKGWSDGGQPEAFKMFDLDLNNSIKSPPKNSETTNVTENLAIVAARSFDALLLDTVRKIIPEVLQIEPETDKSFIDKIRPGRLALEAQRQRIPGSKEGLVETVFQKFLEVIPPELASECISTNTNLKIKRRPAKWSSRPRDMVDEVLVDELVDEDKEWTEYWPEEILVTDRITELILKRAIHEVAEDIQSVFG